MRRIEVTIKLELTTFSDNTIRSLASEALDLANAQLLGEEWSGLVVESVVVDGQRELDEEPDDPERLDALRRGY